MGVYLALFVRMYLHMHSDCCK